MEVRDERGFTEKGGRGAQSAPGIAGCGREGSFYDHNEAWPPGRCVGTGRRGWGSAASAAADHRRRIRPRTLGQGQHPNNSRVARRMEPLKIDDLPEQALLLVDSAPIIYFLEA